MDQVRELDRVLDEEHWNVVSNDIEVAFIGVEPDSEAMDVANGICRTAATGDGRESDEDIGFFIGAVQEGSSGDVRPVAI